MNVHRIFGWIITFLLLASPSPAKLIYVDLNATGSGDGTSWANAYTSIYPAVSEAVDDDEIIVAQGVYYPDPRYGAVGIAGKNITLRSTDPTNATVRDATIIDGNLDPSMGAGIQLNGTETENCVIEGFTIRNCRGKDWGGAISGRTYGGDSSNHATIRYNRLTNNRPWDNGGGGGIAYCDGLIEHNIIESNTCRQYGGGLVRCNGTIHANVIQNNFADDQLGGGLSDCQGSIIGNIITGNKAAWGGGGGLHECHGVIANNIITGNYVPSGSNGGGLYWCNGLIVNNTIVGNVTEGRGGGLSSCYGMIVNCIVYNNIAPNDAQVYSAVTPSYSCIKDLPPGTGAGNTSLNPNVVNLGSWTGTPGTGTWNQGNYYLLNGSPCIDTGIYEYQYAFPITDYEGRVRITGVNIDMGAFEYDSDPDSDGDLIADADEPSYGTEADKMDSDGDGLPDGVETRRGTNPAVANSPPPGLTVQHGFVRKPALNVFPTIQRAIWHAFPTETISVAAGTYSENIHFLGKNIVVQSSSAGGAHDTIIDGGQKGSVVAMLGTETTCTLKGFTITNGNAGGDGGGVSGHGAHVTLQGNIITNNSSDRNGGGVAFCQGPILDNNISENYAYYEGGGLAYCDDVICSNTIQGNSTDYNGGGVAYCNGSIDRNVIVNNHADAYDGGGGLYYCDGQITRNRIQDNTADNTGEGGGGLYYCSAELIAGNLIIRNSAWEAYGGGMYDCSGLVCNNVFECNAAYEGGGAEYCGTFVNNTVVFNYATDNTGGVYGGYDWRNNIIWGNYSPSDPQVSPSAQFTYCCVQDWTGGGDGNINSNPQFVRDGAWTGEPGNSDWIEGDYHLRTSSPCVDGGCLVTDVTNDCDGDVRGFNSAPMPRGDGSDYDIGADESMESYTAIYASWTCYE